MDAYIVQAFLEDLAKELGSKAPLIPDPNPQLITLGYKIDAINGSLNAIAVVMQKTGANLLESAAITMLQRENGALTAENSALRRRQNQLIQVIKDLGSPCIGCKKTQWMPHAPDCDWASDIYEVLERLANATEATDSQRTDQAAG